MPYSNISGIVGTQQVALFGLPDTNARCQTGLQAEFVDNYWGGAEMVYVKANGAIRQGGLVVITPAVVGSGYAYLATEVPNTGNLGRNLYVAMVPFQANQFGWVCQGGLVPVNCIASVAAGTTFGIAAAGQGGANSAGKQVLNACVAVPATQTVTKNGVANNNSLILFVNSADGLFIGAYLSGTGLAAGTTIVDIDPSGTKVTLSAATTAAVNGTVTATYNNGTVFYNVVHLNRPLAQGAIT